MHFYQAWRVYPQLPMKAKTILPDTGFDIRSIELTSDGQYFQVYCTPKGKGKHRVMVKCPCGRDIPFGRMGQHYPTHM